MEIGAAINARRILVLMVLVAVLPVAVLPGLGLKAQIEMPKRIIYGTVYNLFHEEYASDEMYRSAIQQDIASMKEAHLNTVLIFPMSQWNVETKTLKWDRTDFLVKEIEKVGMDFVPLLLKQQQCSHYLPIWKFHEIPGLKEKQLAGGKGRYDVDFMEPEVFPLLENYYRQVVERYGGSPNLSFYNIWNEPHYEPRSEIFMKHFRVWLKQKYGSLEGLSSAWSEPYSDWSEVDYRMIDEWGSSMGQIDYTLFRYRYTSDVLKQLVTTLRKYDSIHPANANPVNTPLAFFTDNNEWQNDNFVMAEGSDIHGISYYPDLWERVYDEDYPHWLYSFAYNTFRCASGDKPYIMTELVSGPQNGLALNAFFSYEDMEKLSWSAFANGCKGILYWKWKPFMRGSQNLGRGLTTIDGSLAPRGEAVRDIGAVMETYGEELYAAKKSPARVAIMLDMTGLQKTQKQRTEAATTFFMNESLYGTYKSLFDQNIGVDLLRSDRPLRGEELARYKVIYLPFQVVMREEVGAILGAYVKQGGVLIADARTATINELDFGYVHSPGGGLMEVFGVERKDFQGEFADSEIQWEGHSAFPKLTAGMGYTGKYFREQWDLGPGVEVLSTFADSGEPALVRHPYGKGLAYLSAVPLGGSYYNNEDNRVLEIMQALVESAGVKPVVEARDAIDPAALSLFRHEQGKHYFIYALNYSDQAQQGKLSTRVVGKVKGIRSILTNEDLDFEQHGDEVLISVEVAAQKTALLRLETK